MRITGAPRIVSSRLGQPRAWTLQSYLADGGYRGLRTALAMSPEDIHEQVKVSFRELMYDPRLGGGIRDDNELKAFIPGGASSPWLGPEHLDVLMANEAIAAVGSMAGSASVVAMDHTTCPV